MINKHEEPMSPLVALETFYKPLFNAAGEGMIVVNNRGKIVLANARVTSLFGYTSDELVGQSVGILVPVEARKNHDAHISGYFQTPKPRLMSESSDLMGLAKDGTSFPVEISLNYFESNGERFGIGLITDITERKASADKILELNEKLELKVKERTERLAESEKLYSTIARNFPDGTINVFNRNLDYVFAEGKELYKMGVTSESLLGSNYINRLPASIADEVRTHLMGVFEGQSCSFTVTQKDQHYELDAVPLPNNNGIVKQILVVEKNVTQQKEAEAEMQRTLEKERELNNLKSRFVSMASHEFRTPLGTILSSVSLIAKYTKEEQQPNRDKHIARIKSSVHNLTGILNDFLSLDKLEAGKVRFAPEDFELQPACDAVMENMKGLLKPGQEIVHEHSGKTGDVFLDKQLFHNILLNLLSNATKYSEAGHPIALSTNLTEKQLEVKVSDRGMGIPQEEQQHLFERFFRAKNATNIQGTGLGLNIVRKYVELLSGQISFQSTEGKGTTFTITFPINN